MIQRESTRSNVAPLPCLVPIAASRLVRRYRIKLASPGTPPIVGASFTARTIA